MGGFCRLEVEVEAERMRSTIPLVVEEVES
jgi:hypothetical protein